MTGFRRWRRVARGLIVVSLVGEVAAAVGGIIALVILVVVRGVGWPMMEDLIPAVGVLGLLGVVALAVRDAQRWRRRRQITAGPVAQAPGSDGGNGS